MSDERRWTISDIRHEWELRMNSGWAIQYSDILAVSKGEERIDRSWSTESMERMFQRYAKIHFYEKEIN